MAPLIKPINYNFDGKEYEFAKNYIDRLLPFIPDYGDFEIIDTINKSDLDPIDKDKARNLYYQIRDLLTEQLHYAIEHNPGINSIYLSDKGLLAKNATSKQTSPIETPIQTESAKRQNSFWTKTFKYIGDNIVKNIGPIMGTIIGTIIAAYIIYKLGWGK